MSKKIIILGALLCAGSTPAFAAKAIDLGQQNIQFLRSLTASSSLAAAVAPAMQETSRSTDFNQTTHIRVKQTYAGYPVWGGDAIVHIPKAAKTARLAAAFSTPGSTMTGTAYQDLQKDLQATPAYVHSPAQAEKAMATAIALYEESTGSKVNAQDKENQLVVYVDADNKAHWVFHLSFYVPSDQGRPAIPTYLMDATNLTVYRQWDNIKTLDNVQGGGFGGNEKTASSKITYDGGSEPSHLPALSMQRNASTSICYLQNAEVKVSDFRVSQEDPVAFRCNKPAVEHNNLYWDGQLDAINGAYSPSNDALYFGAVINGLYKDWYGLKGALVKDDKPMVLSMVTHSPNIMEDGRSDPNNAFWNPKTEKMYFGDGKKLFYPLTSLGVTAHEISHGFTAQHANLEYDGESGGMNEAFSDMAAQAAEFYATGKSTWKIGPEIVKMGDFALRYMDAPQQDCHNPLFGEGEPGKTCSLENMAGYKKYVQTHKNDFGVDKNKVKYDFTLPDVHLSSGIYNKAFYLLATSANWNVRKAFDVMVKAQQDYWTQTSTFAQGACGVVKATRDYKYDTNAVTKAFNGVGVDTSGC